MEIREGAEPLTQEGLWRTGSTLNRIIKYEERGFVVVDRAYIDETVGFHFRDGLD